MIEQMKRVTIPVHTDIDVIREVLKRDTGISMSYSQVFNYLVHFYKKQSAEPRTTWKAK